MQFVKKKTAKSWNFKFFVNPPIAMQSELGRESLDVLHHE
jgi:hypothetical protein